MAVRLSNGSGALLNGLIVCLGVITGVRQGGCSVQRRADLHVAQLG